MFERTDRGAPAQGTMVVVIVVLALLIASGFILWLKLASRNTPAPGGLSGVAVSSLLTDTPVLLTAYRPEKGELVPFPVEVRRTPDARSQVHAVLSAMLADPATLGDAVLSHIKLRELYLDASGTVYADLAAVPGEGIRVSAYQEMLAVYALTGTVLQNVPEAKRVRFLVNGMEAQTLAGHLDLLRTYTLRTDLVKH